MRTPLYTATLILVISLVPSPPRTIPCPFRSLLTASGTPGTGKTLHSSLLAQELDESSTPLIHLNIGELVKDKGFHEGWNDEWQSWTVDEDRLLDYLEEVVNPELAPAGTGES